MARQPVSIERGTVVTDRGTLLRGAPAWIYKYGFASGVSRYALNPAWYRSLRNAALNAVRVVCFDPWQKSHQYPHWDFNRESDRNGFLSSLDRIVDLTAKNDLYAMINYHDVGVHDLASLALFWEMVAPRYAGRPHVFYELCNEPVEWCPADYTSAVLRDQEELYHQVREWAPTTHIVLLSFARPVTVAGAPTMTDVAASIKEVDWTNASVGFHTYGADSTREILELRARFPVLNTEQDLPADAGGCDASTALDGERYGFQTMERLGVSWFAWNIEGHKKFRERFVDEVLPDAKSKGYGWEADFPPQGRLCLLLDVFRVQWPRVAELLRSVVLAVNRVPLGLHLTRIPYRLAVHSMRNMLGRYPQSEAAFARNSYATGNWVPGRSDIDLTVILKPGLSPEDEFAFLRVFWPEYQRLRRYYLMLGEVEILPHNYLAPWTRHGTPGQEAANWLPAFGAMRPASQYSATPFGRRRDRLSYAASVYRHQMVPVLASATLDTLIRYARKIMRYLEEPADVRGLSRPELQAAVVLKLERAARELELKSEPGIPVDVPLLLGEDSLNHVTCVAPPPWLSGKLSRFHSVLASSDTPNRIYLIAATEQEIPACIAATVDSESAACIMGPAIWSFYLRHVDPLEHLSLLRQRIMMAGVDPLPLSELWTAKMLRDAVCAYSTQILNFPFTQQAATMSHVDFRNLVLGWLVRTALYFETEGIQFDFARLTARWLALHPEDAGLLGGLESGLDAEQRFLLLRRLADRVALGM